MVWKIPQKNRVKRVCEKSLDTASLSRALNQTGVVSTSSVGCSPMALKAEDETVDVNQIEAERKRAMGIMYSKQTMYR